MTINLAFTLADNKYMKYFTISKNILKSPYNQSIKINLCKFRTLILICNNDNLIPSTAFLSPSFEEESIRRRTIPISRD